MTSRARTIGILAVLAIGVAVAIAYVAFFKSSDAASGDEAVQRVLAVTSDDIGMGDPNAPITWIEYASANCPHCAQTALEIVPEIKKNYIDTGKVYFVLRDFPLNDIALAATAIARCLPRNQFYPFMDVLYANQRLWHSQETTDPLAALKTLAARAGLSGVQVDNCLADQAVMNRIRLSRQQAIDVLKVQGTPTSFINGQRLPAGPYSDYDAKFKSLLGE